MPDIATRASRQLKPMPEARAQVPYTRRFDAAEYVRLQRGLVPEQMEDKWFIFFETPWLFLHRSWTGLCIYAVRLRAEVEGAVVEEAWVNRAPDEYRETDATHDAKMLAFLVDRLLLGLRAEFPMREGLDAEKASLLVHHVVGYAKLLARLAKASVLVLDDLGLGTPTEAQRHDLLEVMEDRYGHASTVVTSREQVA